MKIQKIVFATTNEGKIREATGILRIPVEPLKIELDEIQSLDFREVIEHKARQAFEKTGQAVLVEDSGIIFNGLGKLPGVFTKWFAKSVGNEGMIKMLSEFENKEATAGFLCCLL
jgi:XTP/dITP diphosphohydrolase